VGFDVFRVAGWDGVPGLVHGFLGRNGGVSRGPYFSLNVSPRVGDDPQLVRRNLALVETLARDVTLVLMRQVHGKDILCVPAPNKSVGPADGMYTSVAGLGLAVLTADCVPVLIIAPRAQVAAAVHAGWRGTVAGVVPAAVRALCEDLGLRPADLLVALGPAIGACCYEVELQVGEELTERWGGMPEAWRPATLRGKLDLRAANRAILLRLGVPRERIAVVGPCTACHPETFFSHRGSGGRTGRQISFVGWRGRSEVTGG